MFRLMKYKRTKGRFYTLREGAWPNCVYTSDDQLIADWFYRLPDGLFILSLIG